MKALSQIFTVRIPSILAISACIILSCFHLSAQSNDSLQVNVDNSTTHVYNGSEGAIYNAVERHGKNFYRNDILLEKGDLEPLLAATPYTYQDIEHYRHGFAVGKGLLIGFGSLAGVGLLTLGVAAVGLTIEATVAGMGSIFLVPVVDAGAIMLGAGVLGLVAGTTVFCVYKARLNKVERAINDSSLQRMSLSFGAQRHGVGFALNF